MADKYVDLIRRHIRLFSAFLFLVAAVVLAILLPLEDDFQDTRYEVWIKVGSEVAKGLLAASAVSFLYDWLLRLDADEQLVRVIRGAVQEGLSTKQETLEPGILDNSTMEIVCLPITSPAGSGDLERFCRLHVHHRFRAMSTVNEVYVVLVTKPDAEEDHRKDACLFFWQLDQKPAGEVQEDWLDCKSLRVNGKLWPAKKEVKDGNVICTFKRPKDSPSIIGKAVLFELDLAVIENCPWPHTLRFSIDRTYLRPTWRIDARPLGAKAVHPSYTGSVGLSKSTYFEAPEAEGTCQVFINDSIARGGQLQFVISNKGS